MPRIKLHPATRVPARHPQHASAARRRRLARPLCAAVALLLCVPGAAVASGVIATDGDKTQSPYFHVPGGDPSVDRLPLKETRSDVEIAGVVAKVQLSQVYKNEGKKAIEAVYVFPGSTRAAVYAMEMRVGKRVIKAKIQTKDQARKTYENAKRAGKTAGLLEQKRPNVFQMNVANILPGDTVQVSLTYVEALIPENGVYEFVAPAVVGPRYTEQTEENKQENWTQNPHLAAGQAPPYTWDLRATVNAGLGIASIGSPSHQLATRFTHKDRATIDVEDPAGGNRDFVLRYRLAGEQIQTGMLLFPGAQENFFLAMMQPPKNVQAKAIPPREYIFIVDVSGSMSGFPINTTKALMRDILGKLKPSDTFNLMMFSGGSTIMAPQSVAATPANLQRAITTLDGMRGGGGTRILQALKKALAMPRNDTMSTSFVVVTDGYVRVEKEAFDLTRQNLGTANMFAFGIGSSVNRHLIEGLARSGMGEPFIVLNGTEAPAIAARFTKYVSTPVLTNIKIDFQGFDAYDVVPKTTPDLFAERPVLVFGKYRGNARGKVVVTGKNGAGDYQNSLNVANYRAKSAGNEALKYLWARHRIKELSDYHMVSRDSELQKQITSLGLTYNLMTPFTSFVAVDNQVRNKGKNSVKVRQALPMPEGVSNNAVGGYGMGSTGMGTGGGGTGWGTIGTGRYGTIGHGSGTGAGYGRASGRSSRKGGIRGRRHASPKVRMGHPQVQGSLDKNIIRRYIRRHLPRIRYCYEKQLLVTPGLQGLIKVRFTIGGNGKVISATAKGMNNQKVEHCVARTLKRIKFPKIANGGTVTVSYPFNFKPAPKRKQK